MGALIAEPERPERFAKELFAFREYMRVERGLSPATIASRDERIRWFCSDIVEISQAAAFADHVEQIAVLAGCGVGLMFNCT
jgi:hypothetical protein